VLNAGVALTGADGLVELILRCRGAEQGDIAAPKQLFGRRPEGHLAHRHQGEPLHDLGRALGLRIERLDVLQRVAEKIEPHRTGAPGRINVEDAAAHGVLAGFHDGAGALEAREIEAPDQLLHVEALARRDILERTANEVARRQALQHCVDGGDEHRWPLMRGRAQAGQRRHAARHDLRIGTDAIVGHGIPGRHFDDAQLGRKKSDALGERLEAAIVARHVQEAHGCAGFFCRRQARQQQGGKAIRHAGQELAPALSRRACADHALPRLLLVLAGATQGFSPIRETPEPGRSGPPRPRGQPSARG
jgi:hypothetical protein